MTITISVYDYDWVTVTQWEWHTPRWVWLTLTVRLRVTITDWPSQWLSSEWVRWSVPIVIHSVGGYWSTDWASNNSLFTSLTELWVTQSLPLAMDWVSDVSVAVCEPRDLVWWRTEVWFWSEWFDTITWCTWWQVFSKADNMTHLVKIKWTGFSNPNRDET